MTNYVPLSTHDAWAKNLEQLRDRLILLIEIKCIKMFEEGPVRKGKCSRSNFRHYPSTSGNKIRKGLSRTESLAFVIIPTTEETLEVYLQARLGDALLQLRLPNNLVRDERKQIQQIKVSRNFCTDISAGSDFSNISLAHSE